MQQPRSTRILSHAQCFLHDIQLNSTTTRFQKTRQEDEAALKAFRICQKPNRKHHLPNHAILEQSFATLAPHSSNPHHSPFTIFAITIAVLVLRHGYHISTLTRSLEVIYLQYNLASFLTSWTTLLFYVPGILRYSLSIFHYSCFPYTIISLAKGGKDQARTGRI